ncbi:MAG: PilN domain-containing protein [Zetaproteobacteria bacterium]|nr:PilN domain-containing protein [Zetaproteobacteria bacterium]
MIRINLLPYRQQLRKQQIQAIVYQGSAIFIAAMTIFAVYTWIASSHVDELNRNLHAIELENEALKNKIGKIRDLKKLREEVQSKLSLIEDLQRDRFGTIGELNTLSNTIPNNVWFTSLHDFNSKVLFVGHAETDQAIVDFMRAMEISGVYSALYLRLSQQVVVRDANVRRFTIEAQKRVDLPKNSLEGSHP